MKPYSQNEINAYAAQFQKLADALKRTGELMAERGADEIYLMYPRRIRDTVDGAASVEKSVDKSYFALLSGNPLDDESTSPRSVRKTRTERIIEDAEELIKQKRAEKKRREE